MEMEILVVVLLALVGEAHAEIHQTPEDGGERRVQDTVHHDVGQGRDQGQAHHVVVEVTLLRDTNKIQGDLRLTIDRDT